MGGKDQVFHSASATGSKAPYGSRARVSFRMDEVVAIAIECENCGTRLSLPIEKLTMDLVSRCRTCGREWISGEHTNGVALEFPAAAIVAAFKRLLIPGMSPDGFRVVFEAVPAEPDR